MPCPHFKVSIVKRSQEKSAVAGAAYQSGTNIFSEYDQSWKRYKRKEGVLHTEILLPAHAPPVYKDRSVLWNAVEKKETHWNDQLARRIVMALPIEVPEEQYPEMVRAYCQKHFVSRGMCCDFAIHDDRKEPRNPHVHILLTLRSIDESGAWMDKCHKVHDLDNNGKRIPLGNGDWKSHRENVNEWNDPANCEIWRHGWEEIQNEYLLKNHRPERVDLRSYERQGKDQLPTVHMGRAACAMEKRGEESYLGNLNRDIQKVNRLMASMKKIIRELRAWLKMHLEESRQHRADKKLERHPPLLDHLYSWWLIRSDERDKWKNVHARFQGDVNDWHRLKGAISYLQENQLYTVEALTERLNGIETKSTDLREKMKKAEKRLKTIAKIQEARQTIEQLHDLHAAYGRIFFKKPKAEFYEAHKEDLQRYDKASLYLTKVNGKTDIDAAAMAAEAKRLTAVRQKWSAELEAMKPDLEQLRNVKRWVDRALEEEVPEHLSLKDQMAIVTHNAYAQQQQKQNQQPVHDPKRTTPDSLN